MKKKTYFDIVATIFLIVGLVHLLRIVTGFEIGILGRSFPIWLSGVEMAIGFYLSFLGFRFAKKE